MIKKYFLRANSSDGEVNLIYDDLKGITDIITLSGKSRTAKNRLMTRLAFILNEKGKQIEGIMNPDCVGAYDGIIIRGDKVAIFDKDCAKGIKSEEICLDSYVGETELSMEDEMLLNQKEKWAYDNLYKSYADAKVIHDSWEKIYNNNMDFARLEAYSEDIISNLLKNRRGTLSGERRTGFFGASTPDGAVNYIHNLTSDISFRYFIKGRPGTGKSTFLKKLAAYAEKMGYDTEVYYCSFDKNSLDMVIIRELSIAVFDSTAPHEVFPAKNGDSILDFYTESGLFGTDEKYAQELEYISGKYSGKIKQGLGYLRLGCSFRDELEFYYERAMDQEGICIVADKLLRRWV